MPTLTAPAPAATSTTSGGSSAAAAAIAYARAQIGKPYRWGAAGPDAFDCSGLVSAAYKAGGVSLPHYTGALLVMGSKVERADLQPGDLVFPTNHHVQLYTGGGRIVEAPQAGQNVTERAMWGFYTARRVAAPATGASTTSNPIAGAWDTVTGAVSNVADALDPVAGIQSLVLRSVFVLAGAGLAVLGLARMVAPQVQKAASGAAPIIGAAL